MSAWSALGWQSSSVKVARLACAVGAALLSLLALICALPTSLPVVNGAAKASSDHPHSTAKSTADPVTCATCHVGVATSYLHAPMRHAMEPSGANPVLESHPNLSVQMGRFLYTVQTKNGQSTYTVSDGTASLSLPIRWAFGQHSQTWVLEKDGNLYEGLVSYFPRENVLATTPGDQSLKPQTVTEAMGRRLSAWESQQCFNCHATAAVSGVKLTLDTLRPGLDCERCHAGSEQHMVDSSKDNFSTLPKSLKKMNAEEVSTFCGQCHRTYDTVVRNRWHGKAFVRFQPYRLANSKCFIGSDPRISCLACHNPHQQVEHSAAFYDSKCLACHAGRQTSADSGAIKTCPVAKKDCASCHMPKIELPGGHALFTDHDIRIVRPGDPYPN